jgi:hypothetical protein
MEGRKVDAENRIEIAGDGGAWQIELKLSDWEEIAVVE